MMEIFKQEFSDETGVFHTNYYKQLEEEKVIEVQSNGRIYTYSYNMKKEFPKEYKDITPEEFKAAFDKAAERILSA